MSDENPQAPVPPPLPPRLRRALDLVYAVEGVVGVRIWQWEGAVAVGISVGWTFPPAQTLERVESAVAPVRHAEETWDFGLLDVA